MKEYTGIQKTKPTKKTPFTRRDSNYTKACPQENYKRSPKSNEKHENKQEIVSLHSPSQPPLNPTIPLIPQHLQYSTNTCAPQKTTFLPKWRIEEGLLNHISNNFVTNTTHTKRLEEKRPKQGSPTHTAKEHGPSLPLPSDKEYNKKSQPVMESSS